MHVQCTCVYCRGLHACLRAGGPAQVPATSFIGFDRQPGKGPACEELLAFILNTCDVRLSPMSSYSDKHRRGMTERVNGRAFRSGAIPGHDALTAGRAQRQTLRVCIQRCVCCT